MEAARALRPPHVTIIGHRMVLDGIVVDDETAVSLVRQREEAGGDPAELVVAALEIGARGLHREQTGADADFVKAEFEKASAQVEQAFAERARAAGETLTQALGKHFDAGSSTAVQHQVRAAVQEVTAKMQQDLVRQFSAGDATNPLAQFQRMVVAAMKQSAEQQDAHLRAMRDRMAELQAQMAQLKAEKAAAVELDAEVERGTAKGRTFEEAVTDALDAIAVVQGDDCDAVGDTKGTTGRVGDVVVAIEACRGPARGRIVFEAKNSRLSKPEAIRELDRARAERNADFAVLVVPNEDKVPARMQTLREYNGDKLIVCFDPEDGSTLALEVAYSLARSRVLMARAEGDGIDAAAIRDVVERALGSLQETQRIKQQLTGATTSIANARGIVDQLESQVRGYLEQVEALLRSEHAAVDG
jgi:hypothetical protein